jgi:hypothetical protein
VETESALEDLKLSLARLSLSLSISPLSVGGSVLEDLKLSLARLSLSLSLSPLSVGGSDLEDRELSLANYSSPYFLVLLLQVEAESDLEDLELSLRSLEKLVRSTPFLSHCSLTSLFAGGG